MTSESPEIGIKGAAFYSLLAAIEQQQGKDVLAQILARLPKEQETALRAKSLLVNRFHPIGGYRALVHAVADEIDDAAVRRLSAGAVERDMNTLYRAVLRALSANTVFGQTARLFGLFYEGGTVEVLERRPGFGCVRYSACHGFDAMVWNDYAGGSECILALSGARGITIDVVEGGVGPTMLAEYRWNA
jgi:hypothetical protein